MADENRLKIMGLLANDAHSVEALAAMLGLKPATVSHHLARLAEAGLVESAMQGHAKMFRLRLAAVHALARQLLSPGALPQAAASVDQTAFDRKVVADFQQPDGTLKAIPVSQKKLQAVLRHLVQDFAPGEKYSEKQVNERLARYHPDTASLRRAMIEYKLMQRAGGQYWRVSG
jgi:biotin operon repressor